MGIEKNLEKYWSYSWQEQRHEFLMSLPINEARELLESLTEDEIEICVNYRTYEHDYICDFLADVWPISEKAFWEYIRVSFRSEEGVLVRDYDSYIDKLCSQSMPMEVWREFLPAIVRSDQEPAAGGRIEDVLEALAAIIIFQTQHSHDKEAKLLELATWFSSLDRENKGQVHRTITKAFKGMLPQVIKNAIAE
jgi:hypothetical protein